MKYLFYLALIILSSFYSCTEADNNPISQIRYGTSFGHCIGYCKHDITIQNNKITHICSGWNDSVETITRTESLDFASWDTIKTNVNIDAFFQLPEVIGCPDCADGGAEWLEIELKSGKSHKVTFEHNNEPNLIKTGIERLRKINNTNSCN